MDGGGSNIKSILRICPPHASDELKQIGRTGIMAVKNNQEINYEFSVCFGDNSTQADIYKEIEPYLDNIAQGVNTSVLAYGATGSGKTYTMCGTEENPGIIPRVAHTLLSRYVEALSTLFKTKVSMLYVEVYNEKVYDLLSDSKEPMPVREDANGKVVIPGLTEKQIKTEEEFTKLFREGNQRRKIGCTLLNQKSSRSHAMLTLKIALATDESITTTKINMVDLAGSENNKRTGNIGASMVESASINRSLFVLNKVVDSLGKVGARIPYRDSKLTRILQDSLSGSSDCVLIVNVKGDASADTLSTLAFAGRSRRVHTMTREEKIKSNPPVLLYRKTNSVILSNLGNLGNSGNSGNSENKLNKLSRKVNTTKPIKEKRKRNSTAHKENLNSKIKPTKPIKAPQQLLMTKKELLHILNSKDFLRIKSLPGIGDMRAEKILNLSKKSSISDLNDLFAAGIPKKVVLGIETSLLTN